MKLYNALLVVNSNEVIEVMNVTNEEDPVLDFGSTCQIDEAVDYAIEELGLDPDELIRRCEWHKTNKKKYPHMYR